MSLLNSGANRLCASLSLLALLPVCAVVPARAQDAAPPAVAPAAPAPVVEGRATWDDRFLYFAFVVDDEDVQGTSARPMSLDAAKDDSVSVYVHTGSEAMPPAAPTDATHALIVSVANGFTFLSGKTGALTPDPTFTVKFGATVQGTRNRGDDRDRGYTITLAVPWDKLGIDPKTIKTGQEIPFVAVVRSRGGSLTATSETVTTEADTAIPVKYGRLRLMTEVSKDVAEQKSAPGTLAAYRVTDKPPLIDGGFRAVEWPQASRFALLSPTPRKPAQVVVQAPLPGDIDDTMPPALTLNPATPLSGMEKHVLARYLLGYQADLRKMASPTRGIYGPDGALLLADQPATGLGPWFSTDRVGWHKAQLAEMRRYGVDTALVQLSGPRSQAGALDEKALLVLLTANRELAQENQPRPDLAPCLDTATLVGGSAKTDLATVEGQDVLWQAVRRWFALVPPEMRLRVGLPVSAAGGRGVSVYPVFLSDATSLAGLDGKWQDEMRVRFAREFGQASGGASLLFVGGDGFGANVTATLPLASEGVGTGAIKCAVVRPGTERAGLVARKDGASYRAGWEAAANANADWVVINSWNDYGAGTEVSASRQYGLRYLDLTRILSITTGGLPEKSALLGGHDAPRRMRPGQVVSVTVNLRNGGRQPLKGADGLALAYRWRGADGQVIAFGPLRLPLPGALLPTQTTRLPLGVFAAQGQNVPQDGPTTTEAFKPLLPGEYTLEIGVAESDGGKLVVDTAPVFWGEEGGKGEGNFLRIPVRIADNLPAQVEIAETVTPALVTSGTTFGTRLRMRWMGDKPLTPTEVQLVYQVLSEDGQTVVQSGTAPLLRPLPPGQWVTEPALVRLGEGGVPAPAYPEARRSASDGTGYYRLRWLLTRTDSTDPITGEYQEAIALYPAADTAKVTPTDATPRTFEAGTQVPMEVTVTNRSASVWEAGSHRVGYHWFHPDGVEAQWRPPLTAAIPKLAPGASVKVSVPVRMPDRDGAFIIAFDTSTGAEGYLSTGLVSQTGDLGLLPVRVTGGHLRFVDLSQTANEDAVATEDKPDDGELGGLGFALPGESFPPDDFGIAAYFRDQKDKADKNGPSYPSGYFAEVTPSARQISFRYLSHAPGVKNAVACDGQTLPVAPGRYVGVHFALVSASGEDRPFAVVLRYKNGTTQTVKLTASALTRPVSDTEAIAVRVGRKRGKDTDAALSGAIRHLVVPVDVTRELAGIELPKDKAVTIFALTLEQ